jgi:hypothetical protein
VSFDEVLTLLVILGVLAVLVAERLSPAFTILAGLVVLLVAGVVDAGEAFSGFSNSAPLTVAALSASSPRRPAAPGSSSSWSRGCPRARPPGASAASGRRSRASSFRRPRRRRS